jgi:hypothetical protein
VDLGFRESSLVLLSEKTVIGVTERSCFGVHCGSTKTQSR